MPRGCLRVLEAYTPLVNVLPSFLLSGKRRSEPVHEVILFSTPSTSGSAGSLQSQSSHESMEGADVYQQFALGHGSQCIWYCERSLESFGKVLPLSGRFWGLNFSNTPAAHCRVSSLPWACSTCSGAFPASSHSLLFSFEGVT